MQVQTLERPKASQARTPSKKEVRRKRYNLADLVAQITDENRHGEVDVGPPVGHEFAG